MLLDLKSKCRAVGLEINVMRLQEKVIYVEKINFKFSTKLGREHPYQYVPEEYKAYCSIEPEKQAYKVWILKNILLRKQHFKFLKDIKMKKIRISPVPSPIWLKLAARCLKYTYILILQRSSKSVKQSANFEKCSFKKIEFQVFGRYKDKNDSYLSTTYTNLAEIWLWNVRSIRVLILQSSSKFVEQKANFKKCTFEKMLFKVFGGYKDEKNSYLSAACTNWLKLGCKTSDVYVY